MHILIFKQGTADIDRYKAKLTKRGHTYEEIEQQTFIWRDGHPDWAWLDAFLSDIFAARAESVDVVKFFLSDWKAAKGKTGKPVVGRSYQRKYPAHVVKIRHKDDETAEHEDLHTAARDAWVYLGIDLSKIMGVKDFHEDVVHGRDPRFTEYEYEEVWKKISPYVDAAYRRRKQLGLLSAAQRAVILMRQLLQKKQEEELMGSNADQLLQVCIEALGTDASPSDLAPDELGCAETASNIIRRVLPQFPIVTGTWTLMDVLDRFERVTKVTDGKPEPGDIILYATGQGRGIFPGHVGFVDAEGNIMSNDSFKGTFERNYTVESFRHRYVRWGEFKEHIYRLTE